MEFFLREQDEAAYRNYRALERELRARAVRLETRPSHVRLDVSSRCNLRCLHCVFTATRATGQDMSAELLERVERELLPNAAALQYAEEGEPFLFEDFARLTDMLGRRRPAYSRIFTNGTLVDESACRRLIECGLSDLAVSLDAAHEATFARVRRTSLAAIVRNLARLRDLKRSLRADLPIVTVHTVVMRENLPELAEVVRLARELGAAEVVFHPLCQYTPEMAAQALPDAEQVRASLAHALETGVAVGLPVRLSAALPQPPRAEREPIDARFYEGQLEAQAPVGALPAGRRVPLRLTVHNRSPFLWYAAPGASAQADVAVAYHVYAADGTLLEWEGHRTPLPRTLGPGGRAMLDAHVLLPSTEGDFVLGFDLVNERARWFGLEQRVPMRIRAQAEQDCDNIPVEATPTGSGSCEHPWKYVSVKANGDVLPCNFTSLRMGNLARQDFAEIWNGARYRRLRASVVDGSYGVCRGALCPYAAAPAGMFRSRLELLAVPGGIAPGALAHLRLRVRNEGTAAWNAEPLDDVPIRFLVKAMLYDERSQLLAYAPQRFGLPHDVAPGQAAEVDLPWRAPRRPGRYVLGLELNRHPVFEFTALGNPACQVPLHVVEARASGRAPLGAIAGELGTA